MNNWKKMDLFDATITYATQEEGRRLIAQHDTYTDRLTTFDLNYRCQKGHATLDEYLTNCQNAVRDFSPQEHDLIEYMLCEINSELKRHGMMLPQMEQINLVRTSGQEENGVVGYTRGNTIYLCQNAFIGNEGELERILVHELFHILTRNNFAFRQRMYGIVGFTLTDKTFVYPPEYATRFFSNPDVSDQICYAYIQNDGRLRKVMPMMCSSRPYCGGHVMRYARPCYYELDEHDEFLHDENGRLCFYAFDWNDEHYLELVGRNTSYLVHPEEVLAENFVLAVLGTLEELPNPEIVENIRQALR